MNTTYFGYTLVFGGILAASVAVPAIMVWLRDNVVKRHRLLKEGVLNHTVFSFYTAVYAFFLGFSVVTLWSAFQNTKSEVVREAASIFSAHQLSQGMPGSESLRASLAGYLQSVVSDEWPHMDATDTLSPKTEELWRGVWRGFMAVRPSDKQDNTLYAAVCAYLNDASKHRLSRGLLLSGNLYPPVWVILWVGAATVFIGLIFLNIKHDPPQIILEGLTVFLLLSCIFFIADLDTPFSGVIKVDPGAFVSTLAAITGH